MRSTIDLLAYMTIQSTLGELRAAVADAALGKPQVSEWSVGMHIHHCALVMLNIGRALRESDPALFKSRFSALKLVVLLSGFIPRGRGHAPKQSLPSIKISEVELKSLLEQAEAEVLATAALEEGRWINHPRFGPLRRNGARRFIAIHNHHHLKIIDEIKKMNKK